MASADVIVISGGIGGAATALGLVEEGAEKVFDFDEHLPSLRLSRGNLGLTWFMCKGTNNSVYAEWCRMATEQWPQFAARLEKKTGYHLELEWTRGAIQAFGEKQYNTYATSIESLKVVCTEVGLNYPVRMLCRKEFTELLPDIQVGEDVTGIMCKVDQGHVNPKKLLDAVRWAFQQKGGHYYGAHSVTAIVPETCGANGKNQ